jgi:hypothetical protein
MVIENSNVEIAKVARRGKTAMASQKAHRFNIKSPSPARTEATPNKGSIKRFMLGVRVNASRYNPAVT